MERITASPVRMEDRSSSVTTMHCHLVLFRQCCKAYHPECVGKDVTLETGELWTCDWHFCFICNKESKFHCFCCPIAVCQPCTKAAEFVIVRGKKGFCNGCLKLVLLIEQNEDVDSDGGKVDFKDGETYECLFMEYWKKVNEKACLKLETLHLADVQLKKGKQYLRGSHFGSVKKGEEDGLVSSSDSEHVEGKVGYSEFQSREEPNGWQFTTKMRKRGVKSPKKKLIGWGSRSLIKFLASIGIGMSKQLSQHEVNSIITTYINKNNLMHPVKKEKVVCDSRLHSFFGRKSINRNKIFSLLQQHFPEKQEQPEEDKFRCNLQYKGEDGSSPCKRQWMSSSDRRTHKKKNFQEQPEEHKSSCILEYNGEDGSGPCKRQRMSSSDRTHKKKNFLEVPQSSFASITPRNINLVYLKRSLVEYLLKTQTFEEKVVGSFVRIKCEHNDCIQRNSHRLLQVTGIKKALGTGDICAGIILQVSDMKKEIYVQMLSDDNFTEGECDDLHQRVRDGLIKKPTVVEFEQKARILHEDITNHWIDKELVLLQNLIDRANEKGLRRDLCEYLERRQVLQTTSERLRLLQAIPTIIAEVVVLEASPEDSSLYRKEKKDDLPRPTILIGDLENLNDDLVVHMKTSTQKEGGIDFSGDGAVYNQNPEKRVVEEEADFIPFLVRHQEESKDKGTAVTLGLGRESKSSICRFTQGSKVMSTNIGSGDALSPNHSSSSSLDEDMGLTKIEHPSKQRSFSHLDPLEAEEVHLDVMPKYSQLCQRTILTELRKHGSFAEVKEWWGELPSKVRLKITQAGFGQFLSLEVRKIDGYLIQALVERWQPSTHTFHLPVGEATVTPLCLSMLTGLKFGGEPVIEGNGFWERAGTSVSKLLGRNPPHDGGRVPVAWFRKHYSHIEISDDSPDEKLDFLTRAFMMFLFGNTFSNNNGHVSLDFLAYLTDISSIGKYDWGGALLTHLYQNMDALANRHCHSFLGASFVWEAWFYELFGICAPPLHVDEALIFPVASRWGNSYSGMKKMIHSVDFIHQLINALTPQQVKWQPWRRYPEHSLDKFSRARNMTCRRCIFSGPGGPVWYLGERVFHQHLGSTSFVVPKDPPSFMMNPKRMQDADLAAARHGLSIDGFLDPESDYTEYIKTKLVCKPFRISSKMDGQPSTTTTTSACMEMSNRAPSQHNVATGVPLTFPPDSDVFIPGYPGWTVPIYETGSEVEIPRPPSVPGIPLPKDIEWFPRYRVEDLMCMIAGLKDMVRSYSHDVLEMRNTIDKLRTPQGSNQGGDAEEAASLIEEEEGTSNNGDGDKDTGV
ncbi:uncharacterized protein LOC122089052 isoform X2 [Macadamia integrifolia]|uniref:uncharacterized protein LOC122089052 isoform X2 n=1 Tax=Macadamia integrifolia TaxID=60698 RepID=UPI001C4F551B|nr:uncharacterized protein LOC122089052 isoform X2 [Macadamia integrifolia]